MGGAIALARALTGALAAAGLRALARVAVAAAIVAALGWLLVELAPGSVAERAAEAAGLVTAGQVEGAAARQAVVDRAAARFDLDAPWPARLARRVAGLARLDLGRSWRGDRPVASLLAEVAAVTALLIAAALALALVAGLAAAVAGARRPGCRRDALCAGLAALALATPPVWLALLAARTLAHGHPLSLFPAAGLSPAGAVLPILCLAAVPAAVIARHGRAALLEALGEPWAQAARARGLDRARLAGRHALRVAAPSLLALAPALVGYGLAAALVVERVFGIRGLGEVVLEAAAVGDAPVVIGAAVVTAAAVALCSALADAAARWADPRLRGGRRRV